jgi:hypothetical protein
MLSGSDEVDTVSHAIVGQGCGRYVPEKHGQQVDPAAAEIEEPIHVECRYRKISPGTRAATSGQENILLLLLISPPRSHVSRPP